MTSFDDLLRSIGGVVFAASAGAKLVSPSSFVSGVRRYDILPGGLSVPFAITIVIAELSVAASHLSGAFLDVGALIGTMLLACFAFAVSLNLRRNRLIPCSCFGSQQDVISKRVLVRILMLVAVEGLLLISLVHTDRSLTWRFEALDVVQLAAVGQAALVIQVGLWLLSGPEVLRLYRRLLDTYRLSREPV